MAVNTEGLAMDENGTTSAEPTQEPTPEPIPSTLHVGDLDAVSSQAGNKWQATVTITVCDADQAPVADATVSGSWSGGYSDAATCTTDGNGQCSLTTGEIGGKSKTSVTFTVDGVTHATLTYQAADNADPDGDSDGTTITVNKPS